MKYPLSYVAAEHKKKKKKNLFGASLASHALQLCEQNNNRREQFWALLQAKGETQIFNAFKVSLVQL